MPTKIMTRLLAGTAISALLTGAAFAADANARPYDIPQQDAATALQAYAMQSGKQVLFPYEAAKGKQAPQIKGDYSDGEVIALLANSAGLRVTADDGKTVTLRPQASAAGQGGDEGTVQALVVTAQKREENIQDVPIAMSAFTQEDLTRSQVAGGPDLMTQIPNFTFTKTNFSSYSIQIRGIGTQAISATVDPAVAIAFNNTPFVRNRFFEQEFFDLQRIEVLRGPQGTLYGRNATAGVVNILSARPTNHYEAKLSGDIANYAGTRLEGMINLPLVDDVVSLRIAGAWTKRDGFVSNNITGEQTDGRNLWAGRLSLRFQPSDALTTDLIYEHFEEDDDRLRSGKQLCKRNPTPTSFDGVPVPIDTSGGAFALNAYTSQGCEASSLYSPDSFQVPNGFALGYYGPTCNVSTPVDCTKDPYVSTTQSRDLREIESLLTPRYNAKSDILQLQVQFQLAPHVTLVSETAYGADELFSFQDFNRFNTTPDAFLPNGGNMVNLGDPENTLTDENGVFCDPQLGCSDRLLVADVSTARSRQFSQEFRLASDFDGPFNFSMGGNFLRYDTVDKYYVFFNSLTMLTMTHGNDWYPGVSDNTFCLRNQRIADPNGFFEPVQSCKYIDPNPISALNDFGRQYFLSKNPYKLISYAVFGEAQYNLTPTLKVTGGLRLTVDKKEAPIIPSWLLAGQSYGLPVLKVIEQEWREPTGRLVLDWRPDIGLTDETMMYASYAHGYKAGGVNPPLPVNTFSENYLATVSASQPPTFEPEFVDAFELGTKNTMADGGITLNADVFFYDYKGYQISQIANRSAVNLNFDAKVWGAELEIGWRPTESLTLGLKGGYERTRMADGSHAIDLMDRTAGHSDWVVVKPWPTNPANCILPASLLGFAVAHGYEGAIGSGPTGAGACIAAYYVGVDPFTGVEYTPDPDVSGNPFLTGYEGYNPATAPNNGEGFFKDLSGNELPNAPHFTGTFTADYTLPLASEWVMTLHSDFYYQSEAWTRVFNTEGYDKLKAYTNVNLAAIFSNEAAGWRIMAYVKNVFDRDSITGAFLNSDDTGLTTNVFLTEPRLYGLRVTKEWTGGAFLGGGGGRRDPNKPYPFTLQLGGGVERHDASNTPYAPAFLSGFSQALDPTRGQNRDFDWGDGREVKLTYAPHGGPWVLTAAVRSGRANASNVFSAEEDGVMGCAFGPPECTDPKYQTTPINYSTSFADTQEDHLLTDFTVGKDVGVGGLGGNRSSVSLGLRYAEFNSHTTVDIHGQPDWVMGKYATHNEYKGSHEADRSFSGAGPLITWDGAYPLIKIADMGRIDVDWSVGSGVLFGKQKARVSSEESGAYIRTFYTLERYSPPVSTFQQAKATRRAQSVKVPTVDLSLGLSYEIQRVRIGAGYRWERYFDVIDGGIEQKQTYDRTFYGPYFKIAVGFGG